MSKLITNTIRHTGGSADNIELDSSGRVGINEDSSLMNNGTLTIKFGTDKHMGFNSGQGELGSMPGLVAYKDNGSLQDIGIRGDNIRFATGSAERARFTDDGLCLGGTGSANALDDYEIGTCTVTMAPNSSGSITLSSSYNTLAYVKIGNLVHIQGRIYVETVSSPSGSYFTVSGLPFPQGSGAAERGFIMIQTHGVNNGGDGPVWIEMVGGNSFGTFHRTINNAGWNYIDPDDFGNNTYIMFNGTYKTDS